MFILYKLKLQLIIKIIKSYFKLKIEKKKAKRILFLKI